MFCFKCGAAMSDDARSCPSCGTPTPVTVAALPPPPASNVPPGNALPAVVPQYVAVQPTEDKAVISMVLGILSLVSLSILAGIPAIILGKMAKDNIRASSGRLGGEGMATAGIVMGWVSVGLVALAVFVIIIIIIVAAVVGHSH